MWPLSYHTQTHTRPGRAACYSECPGLKTQQKPTEPKYHCRVPVSTLADATLIQSAMESHRAEWLQEGASGAVFGRPEGLQFFTGSQNFRVFRRLVLVKQRIQLKHVNSLQITVLYSNNLQYFAQTCLLLPQYYMTNAWTQHCSGFDYPSSFNTNIVMVLFTGKKSIPSSFIIHPLVTF